MEASRSPYLIFSHRREHSPAITRENLNLDTSGDAADFEITPLMLPRLRSSHSARQPSPLCTFISRQDTQLENLLLSALVTKACQQAANSIGFARCKSPDLRWMYKLAVLPIFGKKTEAKCVNKHISNSTLNPVISLVALAWIVTAIASGFVTRNEKADIWLKALQYLQIKDICCSQGRTTATHGALKRSW